MDEFLSQAAPASDPGAPSRDTLDRIQRVFAQSMRLVAGEKGLPYERMLEEAAGLDSIAVLEFMTAVEKEFGLTIEQEFLEFDFLRDFSRLAVYVEARMGKRAGAGE
jgi:acyl carrier protein